MLRIILGWFLIVHAVAHAGLGTWSAAYGSAWPSTVLWTTTFAAYTVAGLGVLRVPRLRARWKPWMVVATIASILLIAGYPSRWGMVGAVVDVALLVVVLVVMQLRIDVDIAVVNFLGSGAFRHPRWVRAGWVLGCAWLAYASVIAAIRPMSLRWGTTQAERAAPLPPSAFLFAPLDVFVLEPVHFIMERGMMRGIRDRAERVRRGSLPGAAGE